MHPAALASGRLVLGFAGVCLGLAATPGPNMAYLVSRSVSQGRQAGLLSLGGVLLAFPVLVALTGLGVTAAVAAAPVAYRSLQLVGGAYLLWLSFGMVRPGGRSPLEVRDLPPDRAAKLVGMGFLTNILNPKAAVLYLSLLPQFVDPRANPVPQILTLGAVQMATSFSVNGAAVLGAGRVAVLLSARPTALRVVRWATGSILGLLGIHVITGLAA